MSGLVDPYTDPETGVLRNRIGARTQDDLDRAEAALTVFRLVELASRYPVRASGDFEELRGIHRHLFQDLYEWAGRVRSVDIRKPGGAPFLPVSRIEVGAGFVFEQLRAENHLRGLDRAGFVQALARHYDALNYVHPFREGNGRTQRVFWSRVARDAGWDVDWRLVSRDRNDDASRAGIERGDLRPLRDMFDTIIAKARRIGGPGPGPVVLEVARLAFDAPATEDAETTPQPSTTRPRRPRTRKASGIAAQVQRAAREPRRRPGARRRACPVRPSSGA